MLSVVGTVDVKPREPELTVVVLGSKRIGSKTTTTVVGVPLTVVGIVVVRATLPLEIVVVRKPALVGTTT